MNNTMLNEDAKKVEIVVSNADEMVNTMKNIGRHYPQAIFNKLEYLGLQNGQLSVKLCYVTN
ncbi:hypothetical protein PP175_15340 [Aneurinibacillus sp. Ricciae_BoGa-3]|uniref:hypothetical protein n=1 Tax=Aneurinibacillus sp. Ricciae_BoGa-3 TaxID=3022697 RepID=UPI0023406E32|nr:hypothetical protein [Aneurinibacillus sp. Ricciae_BoGa-3]WCK52796.1 hypothetical protein PP175_15340 [Aneurinibacillus sp. Ricciae_BoGa-3]